MKELLIQEKNLITITNSLLLLSHQPILHQRYPLIRLDELVFRCVETVEEIYPEAAIHVLVELEVDEESVLQVRASEALLSMAFNNLLKNAIQYSDNKAAEIMIAVDKHERKVMFKNTGETFLEAETELIYDPFYRASNSKKVAGHGLGLAIVKQIAEMHKAEIHYHQDGANIFTFSFGMSSQVSTT
jgi:signal transduction histidine kinase